MSATRPLGAIPEAGGYELPAVALDVGDERTSRRGLLAIAGLLACGAVVAVAAAHTWVLLPQTMQLGAPPSLAGAFDGISLNLHYGGTIAVLVTMFACYAVAVAAPGQLSARTVLTAIAALHAIVLLAPPLISTDIFSYQAYARMGALYSTNPYTHGPYAIFPDHLFPYIGAKWSYIPSVYGPLFTVFSYLLAPLSIAASVFAYKSIAAVASLGLVAVVWHCARLRGKNPVRAVAFVGLNPLLALYGVGGGHNDLLMVLVMVGGVYAVLASRERLGGALSIVAAGIKLTAGVMLPFALAAGGPRPGHRRRDLLVGAGIVASLIAGLSFALFGSGSLDMLATVDKSQSEGGWQSIPGFVGNIARSASAGHAVGYSLAAIFLIVALWLLRRVWRGQCDWIEGAGWAMLAMLVASSSLLPWYVTWLLPLAALGHDRRLSRTAIAFTGVVLAIQMLGYVPQGAGLP